MSKDYSGLFPATSGGKDFFNGQNDSFGSSNKNKFSNKENYPSELEEGKQGKHIEGYLNFIPGKSKLTITLDKAKELVNQFSGKVEIVGVEEISNKERVDFGEVIGLVKDANGNVVQQALSSADYTGRRDLITQERKDMMDGWSEYLYNEGHSHYSDTERFLILKGITQNLKRNNDNLPPILNKQILSDTVNNLKIDLQNDKNFLFNFQDRYKINLIKHYCSPNITTDKAKWIVIPSKEHDPENFSSNIEKLKLLSPDGWCTKGDYAEIYLAKGDFHILADKGESKLGLRFKGDEIQSIEGEKNDLVIPLDYLDECESYIYENSYKMNDRSLNEIVIADRRKCQTEKVKKELQEAIINKDTEKILNYFGMKTNKDKNGYLILSEYKKPKDVEYSELGISEDKMFRKIIKIEGDAELDGGVTSLGTLKEIGGNAVIGRKLSNLGQLEVVGGSMDIYSGNIEKTDNLKSVGGNIRFYNGTTWDVYYDLFGKNMYVSLY